MTKGWDLPLQNRIPGAKGQAHVTLKGTSCRKTAPDDVAAVIDSLMAAREAERALAGTGSEALFMAP
ncbi:MAG: hypothetical protein ACOYNZ_14200 [Rhodoferax sp.]